MFQGYDSITSAGRATAVKGTMGSAGAISQLYYQVCYDSSSLQDALNVSGSVSASYGFGSASAKADYVDDLNVTDTSVSIVVYVNTILASDTYTNVALDVDPPTPESLNDFFQVYGDSFVNQLVLGAEYMATYVFYSQTKAEQKQVSDQLKAHGITDGGSFSVEFQSSLDAAQQSIDTRQTMQQLITGFTGLALPDSDHIVDFALAFPPYPPDAPTVVSFESLGYEHVPALQEVMQPIVATRSLYETLADDYALLVQTHDQVEWLNSVYAAYDYSGDPQTEANDKVVVSDIQLLEALFEEMDANPTLTFTAPDLPALALGTPVLQSMPSIAGPWGAQKGDPFDDVTETWVQNATRITQIQLHGDSHLTGITTTYDSLYTGSQVIKNGECGGKASLPLKLAPGQVVSAASGYYTDDYVLYLTFGTMFADGKQGPTLQWPPLSAVTGQSFIWTRAQDTPLLGFAGRAGKDLNQIVFELTKLTPALWVPYAPQLAKSAAPMSLPQEEPLQTQLHV
jgi:hypothetical protein